MTIKNREVFALDPTAGDIPNLGVAKVKNPEDESDWATLEWELRSFVCEGEYERGLEKILREFLSHLGQNEQPAVWVSGFYGSGKSHLLRVLEYLWRDYRLPSGASARALASLPSEIEDHLVELSAAAKRQGGLWSAAGTLGAGAAGSVRIAFLAVILDAAGLPQQYAPARLAIWLKDEGLFDSVREHIESSGKSFDHELRNLYVSPPLAQALIDAGASFGETRADVSKTLQAQFPNVKDIDNDELLDVLERVLYLQSDVEGKLPLTLVVLDELQQYLNDDNERALVVQGIVEAVSSRFDSQVVVAASGQAALTANPTLQRLTDRFLVTVALSDTDVESVVRQVVLRKNPEAVAQIEAALDAASGEVDRQLAGTGLEAKAADKATRVADYPLLPTRRRFWEKSLRAIDKAGRSGVLRTQLKIVHEAARSVADEPLGHVIGGDFVFQGQITNMLQSGVLLKEIDELIRGLQDGSPDGELKSRACAVIFLVSQLAHEGVNDTGVRARADIIADLLVEDLATDGARLRKEVPRVLDELVELGRVMKLGDEYWLQTEEGAEWTKDFSRRRASVRDDPSKILQLRNEWLLKAVDEALAGIKLMHGNSKTVRKFERHWGEDEPSSTGNLIPVWIRDEWNVTDAKAKEAAARAGDESPVVFVLLPKIEADAIRDALAGWAAASDTVQQRAEPQTDEGRQAKQGMQSRVDEGRRRLESLFGDVVARARVFQGGGNELTTSSLRDGVEAAGRRSLDRMYPKFGVADHADWDKVITKARAGAPDALASVGWTGEVTANAVCKEVLAHTSGAGTKGSDLQREFGDRPYGWPTDAINGALLGLLASGNIRAERDNTKIGGPKELPQTQVSKATFYKEDEPPTLTERMAVRGLLAAVDVKFANGEEGAAISGLLQRVIDLAAQAGGPPPLPAPPDTTYVDDLGQRAGNQQFRAVADRHEQLAADIAAWTAIADRRPQRLAAWSKLDRLLDHAAALPEASALRTQRDAISANRLLLDELDPVAPLVDHVGTALRSAVIERVKSLATAAASERSTLEAADGWSSLNDDELVEVLAIAGVDTPPEPDLSSPDAVLASLDAHPLAGYLDRIDALPAKASAARKRIAQIIDPEPVVVSVKPPHATIKSEADVDTYVTTLRSQLVQHVEAGETVII